jgi:uncharacterized protein DUF6894
MWDWTMKKYFFDVIGNDCTEIDFHGRAFSEPQKAFEVAHMLALDMEVGYGDEYSGRAVHVRSAHGDNLFSVAIRQPDQIAA